MSEYIKCEKLLEILKNHKKDYPMETWQKCGFEGGWHEAIEQIEEDIKNISAANVISKSAYDQILWERDVAEAQLTKLGLSLGEKPDEKVRSIKHSSWDLIKTGSGIYDFYFKCRNCHGNTPDKAYTISPDYCPNCGAKMD